MTNVTSAGQFAGIQTMMLPGRYLEMLISQMTINARYSFMSIALSQKLDERFKGIWRWILGFFVTDEIFAVAISEEKVSRSFFAGLATLPYLGWSIGTALGAIMGNVLPQRVLSALGLALYGMFVAIVVPVMKTEKAVILAVVIAAAISCAFTFIPLLSGVSTGLVVTIAAIISAAVVSIIKPVEDEGGAA